MDALTWGFHGMKRIETLIVVAGGTVIVATRGPIVDRWHIFQRVSTAEEDAHHQAMRDTIEAEREGQKMMLPPTRVTLKHAEAESLVDPYAPAVTQGWVNGMLSRAMAEHLKSGLVPESTAWDELGMPRPLEWVNEPREA